MPPAALAATVIQFPQRRGKAMRRSLTTAGVFACFMTSIVTAQDRQTDGVKPPPGQVQVEVQAQRQASQGDAGKLDSKTRGSAVRASQLKGTKLENAQGDHVGNIHNMVIDTASGDIRYVAVTYGGFLGFGNKLFAVPFEALQVKREPGDSDDHVMILDVSEEQLKGAEGFDEDRWPSFADESFASQLDKLYGIDRKAATDRAASSDPSVAIGPIVKAGDLIGMQLRNRQNERVGKIDDLVIDAAEGKLRYVAVTYGGFLGFGNKLFAVPFESFHYQRDADDQKSYVMVLDVTQDSLDRSEGFDQDRWPDINDPAVQQTWDSRYGIERQKDTPKRNIDIDVDIKRDSDQ
jgi:sporulation protein YlmC with PRC-barrel domain